MKETPKHPTKTTANNAIRSLHTKKKKQLLRVASRTDGYCTVKLVARFFYVPEQKRPSVVRLEARFPSCSSPNEAGVMFVAEEVLER